MDAYYINRAFDLDGRDYRAETAAFMAAMPYGVDATWAEFLLRPLSSGALNLSGAGDGVTDGGGGTGRGAGAGGATLLIRGPLIWVNRILQHRPQPAMIFL